MNTGYVGTEALIMSRFPESLPRLPTQTDTLPSVTVAYF
jgi:hypothetical protein